MATIYVARSVRLGRWASDVGLGKHVYKVGVVDGDSPADELKALTATGWAGESDWAIVRKQEVTGPSEGEIVARLAGKEKLVDPNLYPKLKGATGIFRLDATRVENHIVVSRALAGQPIRELKLKPTDFAAYLIHNATR